MRIKIIFLMTLICSMTIQAEEVTQGSLQGSWRIVQILAAPYDADDRWVFKDNMIYEIYNEHKTSAIKFKIVGQKIIIEDEDDPREGNNIVIISLDSNTMKAKRFNYDYILKKQP